MWNRADQRHVERLSRDQQLKRHSSHYIIFPSCMLPFWRFSMRYVNIKSFFLLSPWEAGSQHYFTDKEAKSQGLNALPWSHNYRQLGVLGIGLGVRNPCLGSLGSQTAPSLKIILCSNSVGILLCNREVMGLLTCHIHCPSLACSYRVHFQKAGLGHVGTVYNSFNPSNLGTNI